MKLPIENSPKASGDLVPTVCVSEVPFSGLGLETSYNCVSSLTRVSVSEWPIQSTILILAPLLYSAYETHKRAKFGAN